MFNTIQNFGIPVLLNGDWIEETPLGRAEWIKFFGVLFNKEKEADSIFNDIENNYLEAKNIALKTTNTPTVISGGLFKDIWNLPAGDSFEAAFLKDANTNYLWENSKGKGSLSLNIENVFEKGKDADIWISPGFYATMEDLEKENLVASKMKAFNNKTIYSYNNTTGVFNIPNYGSALSGYVPTSRQLTINGTAYDLSADRTWSVGTVTSVAALTLGTSGTDLSSTVANSGTTPVITLNVPNASTTARGVVTTGVQTFGGVKTFNSQI